jgi:hypothetical protein
VSGLLRYFAGYLVDSFRERLAVDDLRGENVRRVRVAGEADEELRALIGADVPGAGGVRRPAERW